MRLSPDEKDCFAVGMEAVTSTAILSPSRYTDLCRLRELIEAPDVVCSEKARTTTMSDSRYLLNTHLRTLFLVWIRLLSRRGQIELSVLQEHDASLDDTLVIIVVSDSAAARSNIERIYNNININRQIRWRTPGSQLLALEID